MHITALSFLTVPALLCGALACDAGSSSADDDGQAGAPTGAGGSSAGSGNVPVGGSMPTGGTSVGCTPGPMPFTGELMGQYGKLASTINGIEYLLQVNQWNSTATQVVAYGGPFHFKMLRQDASVPTNGGPTGYPSMFIGANAGNSTANSGLPKQVSTLTRVPTTWVWDDAGTLSDTQTNSYNASYDVWFSTGPGGDPNAYEPSAGFLMVWLYDPPDAQPIGGTPRFSGVPVQGVPGVWDIWIGTNNNKPIISYLARQAVKSLSFDMNDFIKDAVNNRTGTVQNSWYLSNVFIGFEIWRGGVGLETTSFCVNVQ